MEKKQYDFIKNLLKAGTYSIIGAVGSYIVELLQGGADVKQALILGLGFGIVSGIKNLIKHYFGYDLDFAKLKK